MNNETIDERTKRILALLQENIPRKTVTTWMDEVYILYVK